MSKYIVETKEGTFVGEYSTTRQVADAMKASPAKTKQAIDNMPTGKWNRLGDYRIGVKSDD